MKMGETFRLRRGGNRKGVMFRILRDIAPFLSLKRLVAGIGRMSIFEERQEERGRRCCWEMGVGGYGRVFEDSGRRGRRSSGGGGSKGGAMGKFTVVGVLFEGECGIMNSRAVALSKCVRRIRRIGDESPASGTLYRTRLCSAKLRRHYHLLKPFAFRGCGRIIAEIFIGAKVRGADSPDGSFLVLRRCGFGGCGSQAQSRVRCADVQFSGHFARA